MHFVQVCFQKIMLMLLLDGPQRKRKAKRVLSYSGFEGLYGYIMDYITCIIEHKAV